MAMNCVAMGDQKAMEVAQVAHVAALQDAGVLQEGRSMAYGFAPPRGPLWEGVYCDDYAILGVCDHEGTSDPVRQDVLHTREQ